jgi:hypothetical protein
MRDSMAKHKLRPLSEETWKTLYASLKEQLDNEKEAYNRLERRFIELDEHHAVWKKKYTQLQQVIKEYETKPALF